MRWLHIFFGTVLLVTSVRAIHPAFASDAPRLSLSSFEHTAFTPKDGAPTEVASIIQRPDGTLWLAGDKGITIFDGVSFRQFAPAPGEALLAGQVAGLFAMRDGAVVVTYSGQGLSILRNGHLTHFGPDLVGSSPTIAGEYQGETWAFTGRRVRSIKSGAVRTVVEFKAPPAIDDLVVDGHNGNVWMLRDGRFWVLPHGATHFEDRGEAPKDTLNARLTESGIMMVSAAHDVHFFRVSGDHVTATGLVLPAHVAYPFLDREGAVWLPDLGKGLVFYPSMASASPSERQTIRRPDGLSGSYAFDAFEDREGNVWVATAGGIDRFRTPPFSALPLPDGMHTVVVTPTADETWVGSENYPLQRMAGGKTFPGGPTMALAQGVLPDGRLLTTSETELFSGSTQGVTPLAQLPKPGQVKTVLADKSGRIFVVSFFNNALVHVLWDGQWSTLTLPSPVYSLSLDDAGAVWAGGDRSRLFKIDNGQVQSPDTRGLNVDVVKVVMMHNGELWVGGSKGLQVRIGDHFQTVRLGGQNVLDVTGLVFDKTGALWVHALEGLARIAPADVSTGEMAVGKELTARWFGTADGIIGVPSLTLGLPSLKLGADGRLWVQNDASIASIDPAALPASAPPPLPTILSPTPPEAGNGTLRLKGARALSVSYTAPALSDSGSVRFRYRLAGFDAEWQNAGERRQAFYTGLPEGAYRFEVQAGNRAGQWSPSTFLAVDVAPRLFETMWFRSLATLAVLGLLYLGWRFRLNQITSALRIRLDERSAVARDMHDTLLQGAQAMAFRLDVIAGQQSDPPAREELAALADYARRTIEEGRSKLEALRAEHEDDRTPVSALVRLGNELGNKGGPKITWATSGKPRAVNPLVGAQIRSVGREMLSNAFFHASATHIHLHANFGKRSFTLTVQDDGCGVDMAAAAVKRGHFGLSSMRERTLACGGRLTLERIERGTLATMNIPASRVYARPWRGLEALLVPGLVTRAGERRDSRP